MNYDGFFFLPGKSNTELVFNFFELTDKSTIEEEHELGYKYHIALFTVVDNEVRYEYFNAILGDALEYAKGLCGFNTFGCLLKKSNTSQDWWSKYVMDIKKIHNNVFGNKYKISV